MPKLTETFVRDLKLPEAGEQTEWDTELRGFGVRMRPRGRKHFILKYRTRDGAQRKLTLGVYPNLSAADARKLARQALGDIERGADPAKERREQRAAPTMRQLADDYIERHGPTKRPSSLRGDKALFENVILPKLGKLKVAAVARRDIEDLHRAMADRPYYANRMLALLSSAFNLAVAWGWRADNPAKGIKRYHEEKRQRPLTPAEARRLMAELDQHPNRRGACYVKLLLLTGARRSELAKATWSQLDLERGVWTKPSAHTKQKRTEHVPLSPEALEVLREVRAMVPEDVPFVFPGDAVGKPYAEPKRFWASICQQAEISGVRLHDLRHTFVSLLVQNGVPLYTAGKLAGHTQVSTTQRYAHLADDPLREAASIVGAVLGTPAAEEAEAG